MLLVCCLACSSVSCSVFQDEQADLSNMPCEYLDLKGVYSTSLGLLLYLLIVPITVL